MVCPRWHSCWERDRASLELCHRRFCSHWKIRTLHMTEIQAGRGEFGWLNPRTSTKRQPFLQSLTNWMGDLPVLGHGCVIDRVGYQQRYLHYGNGMWDLCRTAFSVIVERATKFAISQNARLRVDIERCGEREDRLIESYFEDLKSQGMPFAGQTSGKYQPLGAADFAASLYEFRKSTKRSAATQVADLFLWNVCRKALQRKSRFEELRTAGRWIDCALQPTEVPNMGIKYSCFPVDQ